MRFWQQHFIQALAAGLLVGLTVMVGPVCGSTLLIDNFSTQFDYSGGAVSGIWSGSYNTGGLTNGVVAASPSFADNGLLVIGYDDNLGWEGGRSTAPFLYVDVPANNNFVAEVTIAQQKSGLWSDAGIIARVKQGTPPGASPNNDDENFTFFGSFRPQKTIPDSGSTLHKRIEGGAQLDDIATDVSADAYEPLPLRLRLEKSGADYIASVSQNGGARWQIQSTVRATAGTGLADGLVPIEVGLSFSSFRDSLMGAAKFDDFSLEYYQIPEPAGATLGDVDENGVVDGADFLLWQRGDSMDPLSASDLADWEANFGAVPLATGSTAVPEPGTLICGFISVLAGCGCRCGQRLVKSRGKVLASAIA